MRKLPLLLVVTIGLIMAMGAGLRQNVTLAWDWPIPESPDAFIIYHSTNVTVTLTNWQKLVTVSGTNREVTVPAVPGVHFYYATSSNYWGESVPSNTASTPDSPRSGVLRIQ